MPGHDICTVYCCYYVKGASRLCWRKMAFWTQLGLLLWKNFTYRRRQTVSTSPRVFWDLKLESCSFHDYTAFQEKQGNILCFTECSSFSDPWLNNRSGFGKTLFKLESVVGRQKPEGLKVLKTSVLNSRVRECWSTETLVSDQAKRVHDCCVQQNRCEMKTRAEPCSAVWVKHCQAAVVCPRV